MSDSVIVALIGLVGSSIGSGVGIMASSRMWQYRIEQLEKKVDKHNSVVERTYKLEEEISVLDERVKTANHRIADLEKEQLS